MLRDKYGQIQNAFGIPKFLCAGIASAGLFLRHLYGALTGRHAVSSSSYPVQSEGPAILDVDERLPLVFRDDERKDPDDVLMYNNPQKTFFLFDNRDRRRETVAAPTATERLAQWMNRMCARDGLTPIWIDLDGQYTIAGVVGAIIDECRRSDPTLPPAVLPPAELADRPSGGDSADATSRSIRRKTRGETNPYTKSGVRRVSQALRRGRYFVALDGFEVFSWPQTYHHGAPQTGDTDHRTTFGLFRLARFIDRLTFGHAAVPVSDWR